MLEWLRRRLASLQTARFKAEAQLAEDALVRGDFSQADTAYKAITERWPHVSFMFSRRGRALVQLGRHTEAKAEFQRALKIDPEDTEGLFGMGLMAQTLGNEREASDYFEKAFNSPHQHLEAGVKLADASLARGLMSVAADFYQRVLDVNPNSVEAHYGFGQVAMLEGREADAMGAYRRALAIAPDSVSVKATTVFGKLFPKLSMHQPRPTRPLICVPIIPAYYQDWLGGQNYLINFVRILSSLPRGQRPRVLVAALWDDELDIANLRQLCITLFEAAAVIGVINSRAELNFSKPILDRMIKRHNGISMPHRPLPQEIMSIIDWTFPVLYPLWRVPSVPGPLFWIPDLQHRYLPSFFSADEIQGRDRDMRALSFRAAPIVFSSNAAERDFQNHFLPQRSRTHVWHFVSQLKVNEAIVSERRLEIPRRYYYTPNQFWRHKDHITLFLALRAILDQGHDVTFVCTGSDLSTAGDEYSRHLLQLVDDLSLGKHLRLLGVLPRHEQIEIMRNCCAVIQPSLFEGWSTVVEDAQSIGRPIIASDIPVHREQLGRKALFFEPGNAESLAAAVISVDKKLKPGPEPEQEAAALLELEKRMQKSAHDFLQILTRERGRTKIKSH